jgi:hypothetical protein
MNGNVPAFESLRRGDVAPRPNPMRNADKKWEREV